MYQINTVLNPSAINDVLQGLHDENIQGATMYDVLGKGCLEDPDAQLSKKVMLIVVVKGTTQKDRAMEAIRSNAQELEHGSGKMWVTPVLEAERIRTGEKDLDALSQAPDLDVSHTTHVDLDAFTSIDTPAS